MASLKDLRNRISSVKSTQKITSAMKMVAAAKLRRAQEQAEAARPYAERMGRMLGSVASSVVAGQGPKLLSGTGSDQVQLVVVATADRGLCGGFNSSIVREAKRLIDELKGQGKDVKVLCVGRKGRDQLRRTHGNLIIETIEDVTKPYPSFEKADEIAETLRRMFAAEEFDVCTLIYARFKSAIAQLVTRQQLIPFTAGEISEDEAQSDSASPQAEGAVYEYEPSEEQILADLLPRNLSVQIYRAILENNASEHGARMTAMDNATRNAGEMINKLTLQYNRTRQAAITTELIEIISAKEAM
ncbi:F0F1 ATP synthase subunit gamma [Algihabitans albus]|uniref:F0F1 ATP synthase subunit gamma n=1 Tax=Algihabitans albus TaxID=2164067 RepID=UPI000E5CEEB4|nr:F0F1 ATP synthase subunit gamma [Algihabitans albus]